MHFLSATGLFFLAVAGLAYLPGEVLLLFLKRKLSPLEDVCLASSVGLLMSGLVYWLMGFGHQGRLYLLWPVTSLTLFLFLHAIRRKRRRPNLPPSSRRRQTLKNLRQIVRGSCWPALSRLG